MSELSEFLEGTVGRCLYDFWLDCESYKDTVDDVNSADSRQLRSRLFRCVSCTLFSAERDRRSQGVTGASVTPRAEKKLCSQIYRGKL